MNKNLLFLCLLLACLLPPYAAADDGAKQRAVLITGASSGIGRLAAERLAEAGYYVYAGARSAEDIAELNAIENVSAVRLDVTRQDEIDAAVAYVRDAGRGLWGVVNNAGINTLDPLIEATEKDLDFLFDVNVYGVFRVTRAFAPLVIDSGGRIVNISSISGILSGGLTGYGMYTMSKHAVEAYTDQLAFEMEPLGVRVIGIEPGSYSTEIGDSRCERMLGNEKKYRYYGEAMEPYFDLCRKRQSGDIEPTAPPPDDVAAAIEDALFADEPKAHYMVVPVEFQAMITISKLFEELLALNQDQPFSYTRDELIALMDEEWAILKGEKARNWDDN